MKLFKIIPIKIRIFSIFVILFCNFRFFERMPLERKVPVSFKSERPRALLVKLLYIDQSIDIRSMIYLYLRSVSCITLVLLTANNRLINRMVIVNRLLSTYCRLPHTCFCIAAHLFQFYFRD